MAEMFIPFDKELVDAIFVERPNRFIVLCRLQETNELVEAHLADSGRLKELLLPGKRMLLRKVDDPKRKTKFSAVITEREDGDGWVSINATLPNSLAKLAVENNLFSRLKGWRYIRSEYTKGGSRWDLLLNKNEEQMVVEVKGVGLVENEIGLFPDAVTKRGTKHVTELASIVKEEGWQATLIFVAQREDLNEVMPAKHIDPAFAMALKEAKAAGVNLLACRCRVTREGVTILGEINVSVN